MIKTTSANYNDVKAISNSLMGVYEEDFKQFVDYWIFDRPLQQKKTSSLSMGTLIDTLLTSPDEYDNKFICYTGQAPTGQLLSFCNILNDLVNTYPETPIDNFYQLSYDEVGFKRDKLEKVIEKFKEISSYWEFLRESRNKSVVTVEDISKAQSIVEELKLNPYTKSYVLAHTNDSFTVDHQLEIYEEIIIKVDDKEVLLPIKGCIDKSILNHTTKRAKPLDYKSSFKINEFNKSYKEYKYPRQGSFYTFLYRKWLDKNGYSDYIIDPFVFTVGSTSGENHYNYRMSDMDITGGKFGGYLKNGMYMKGWYQILLEIAYMTSNSNFSFSYECQKNNGMVILNEFTHVNTE